MPILSNSLIDSLLHLTLSMLIIGITLTFAILIVIFSFSKMPLSQQFIKGSRRVASAFFLVSLLYMIERILCNYLDHDNLLLLQCNLLGALQSLLIGQSMLMVLHNEFKVYSKYLLLIALSLFVVVSFGYIALYIDNLRFFYVIYHLLAVCHVIIVTYFLIVVSRSLKLLSCLVTEDGFIVKKRFFYVMLALLAVNLLVSIHLYLWSSATYFVVGLFFISFYIFTGIAFFNKSLEYTKYIQLLMMESKLSIKNEESDANALELSPKVLERLEDWIAKKSFLNPDFSVDSLAKYIGSNRTYLSQYINQRFNATFSQWISKLRINEAKTIMKEQVDLSIEEIAYMTGFSSKSYFIKIFQKCEGVTPNQWKLSN